MADQSIGGWDVGIQFSTKAFDKSIKHVEKSLRKVMKIQAGVGAMGGISPRGPASTRSASAGGMGPSAAKSLGGEALLIKRESMLGRIAAAEERIKHNVDKNNVSYKRLIANVNRLKAATDKTTSVRGFNRLNQEISRMGRGITHTTREINRATAATKQLNFASRSLDSSVQNLARSYLSVFAVLEGGKAFFRTAVQMESMKASLLAVSGNVTQSAADFEFLKKTSLELGVSLTTVADGYRKIGIGAKSAGFSIKEAREILLAGTEASTAFGLGAEQANLVLLAMGQIISKGRVSREELGRQMGEQFPAMAIGAKAMNVELKEFEKLVESGGLSAKEFMIPFARELRKTVKDTGALAAGLVTVRAELGRLATDASIMVDEIMGKKATSGLKLIVKSIREIVSNLTPFIKTLMVSVGGLVVVLTGIASGFTMVFDPIFTGLNFLISKVLELTGVLGASDGLLFLLKSIGAILAIISINTAGAAIATLVRNLGGLLTMLRAIRTALIGIGVAEAFATGGLSALAGAAALAGVGLTVAALSDTPTANIPSASPQTSNTTNNSFDFSGSNGVDSPEFRVVVEDAVSSSMSASGAMAN